MNAIISKKGMSIALCIFASQSAAAELKDAFLRDDDLSGTIVESSVSVNDAGHYVYSYDVISPESNTGYIRAFSIDLSCASAVDDKGFVATDYQSSRTMVHELEVPGVPVAVDSEFGQGSPALSVLSEAIWGVSLNPGDAANNLSLVSPYPPGDRQYELRASVDYQYDQYNYQEALESEDRDLVPWSEDWSVSGVIPGPACPGFEYPDDGTGGERFEGTLVRSDTDETNNLLTYSAPLRDQLTLQPGDPELTITVHYSEDIDPKTFRVTPANQGWDKLFDPQPGSSETVVLPLSPGKSRVQLEVQSARSGAKKDKADNKGMPKGGVRQDKDVFVVRVIDGVRPRGNGGK